MDDVRLLPLLDTLYDAVSSPALWTTFLQRAVEYMDASSAWLSHLDLEARTGSGLVFGIDPAMQEKYFSYYNMFDPFSGYGGDSRDHAYDLIVTDEYLVERHKLLRSKFYAEFMQKIDVDSISFVRLGRRGSQVKTLNINRSRNRAAFGSTDLKLLRFIQGHVLRAVLLSERLAEMQLSAPDDAPEPILFLVDGDMRVHHESNAVEGWMRKTGGFGGSNGRLSVRHPDVQDRLAYLVRSTVSRHHAGKRGGSLIYKPEAASEPIEIFVTPVRPDAIGPFPTRATTLVAVRSVKQRPPSVAERYGLTSAEETVAQLLIAGMSPREIARERGVSSLTLRTQVSRIMAKTGTHRQVEMMRALMLAAADVPVRPETPRHRPSGK